MISSIPSLVYGPSQNRTSGFPTSGSSVCRSEHLRSTKRVQVFLLSVSDHLPLLLTPCIVSVFLLHWLTIAWVTFARRSLLASSLCPCGLPVPITRDAAFSHPLFYHWAQYSGCSFRSAPKGCFVARLVVCLSLCNSMPSSTPGRRSHARLLRAQPLGLRPRVTGSALSHTFEFLGAMSRIQSYTLHLAALVYLLSGFRLQVLHF